MEGDTKGESWHSKLDIKLDPSLLEDDRDGGSQESDYIDSRQEVARYRKFSTDKKLRGENDRSDFEEFINRMRQPKGGYGSNRRSYSPKVRQNRKGAKKYSTRDLMADQDVFDYESDTAGNTRTTVKLNKSQDLEEDESFNSTSQSLGPAAYGLPSSIRQADSVPMVETTNRFMSLSSRPVTVPVASCVSVPTSGYNTPRKKSSIGGRGRQEFYTVLTALNQSRKKETERDATAARQETAESYEKQMSQEDTLWQNELKDVIWLELQAWFAGADKWCQDQWIHHERNLLEEVATTVTSYTFQPDTNTTSFLQQQSVESSTANDIYYDAQESIERQLSSQLDSLNIVEDGEERQEPLLGERQDTLTEDLQVDGIVLSSQISVEAESTVSDPDNLCDSLDVWSERRVEITEQALAEVEELLKKIDRCERLFPSRRRLQEDNELWGEEEFSTRVKVLCMWFNITVQLHQKTQQLGHVLVGLGARDVPWPAVTSQPSRPSQPEQEASKANTPAGEEKPGPDLLDCKKSPVKVRFQVSEDTASTTSPSDSNNSDSSVALQTGNKLLGPRRQDSGLSNISLNSSFVSDTGLGLGPEMSPYRKYLEKYLKSKGIKKTMQGIHRLTRGLLHRARVALEQPEPILDSEYLSASGHHDFQHHLEGRLSSLPTTNISDDDVELKQCGCSSSQFKEMNLPSFRAVYLFLCRVPKDIILECLKIRLEQKPLEPSELSIRQLMRECKDALKLAACDRQKYISRVKAAVHDLDKDQEFLKTFDYEMIDFDSCLTKTLDVYLEYLKNFVSMIQGESSILISTYQKNLLEQEWEFIKNTCPHIPGGEARASETFCELASGMFSSIGNFLQSGSDEIIRNLSDATEEIDMEESTIRKTRFEALRSYQSLFVEARERIFKAVAFAKLLRKDLEVSAEFSLKGNPSDLIKKLCQTKHVKVFAPNCDHWIFVSDNIADQQENILTLLNMHFSSSNLSDNKGYLVIVDPSVLSPEEEWPGRNLPVKVTADTMILVNQIRVSGVLLVAPNSSLLEKRTKDFSRAMRDCLSLVKEHRATSPENAGNLDQVKTDALQLRALISVVLMEVEEKCDSQTLDQYDKEALSRRMKEILHQCYKFGFEYHKELDRLMTGWNYRQDLASGVINFSMQWMNFVLKFCDRGRGLKPDWANKGMEFLHFSSHPDFTKYITDQEFEDLKNLTGKCHSHVMGDSSGTPERRQSVSPHIERDRTGRFSRSNSRQGSPNRSFSRDDSYVRKDSLTMPPPQSPVSTLPRRRSKTRKSLTLNTDECDSISVKVPGFVRTWTIETNPTLPWRERVKLSIEKLEEGIEETRRDLLIVGKVLDKVVTEDKVHIRARQVKFSWQRGVKIGQGNFGKVYTAINNETGDIMAMKEIPLQHNDHRTLKSVAEELRIFESIHHPHLVKHFGVEIHREEMLIFMEYCPEGTLEVLVSSTEEGLEEWLIRRYTRQLVDAVTCLHEAGVVHRDIKTANIFLTEEMKTIKLGDFGCAVKIKAHTTMPGELQGFVGTQAYMAPEVFTRNMNEGHGRAADIWSLACVVLEMVQGVRPWADLASNYQIMFKVGMGQSPEVPEHLSEEGKNFLGCCFVHNPEERASAQDLLSHNFTKIFEEEDNQSLPMFASASEFSEMRKSLVRKDSGKF